MFELWLLDCGSRKIQVIKEIRVMSGLGLREAKDIADRGGLVLRRSDDRQIEAEARVLREAGASVEVRPTFSRRWYVFDPNRSADQEIVRIAMGGTLVETRTKRFGDAGSAQLVRAATEQAAQEMAILQVARLRAQGHAVTESELEAFLALAHRSPELERAIDAAPDDRATHHVYADWLLDRGDLRGELISLSLAGADTSEWMERNLAAVLGPLARNPERMRLTWKHGAIETLAIDRVPMLPEEEIVEALVHLPAAHRLEKLEVPAQLQQSLATAELPKSCVELTIGGDWFQVLSPAAIASLARRFDRLRLFGVFLEEVALDSDRLKSLEITSGGFDLILGALCRAHLPALAQLRLQEVSYGYDRSSPEMWSQLFAVRFPSLVDLALIDLEVDLRILLRSRMVQQLSVLRLGGSTLRPEVERLLEEEARSLQHLQVVREQR